MPEKKMIDTRNVYLSASRKQKGTKLKVSWTTFQGSRKKRGFPTIEYLVP